VAKETESTKGETLMIQPVQDLDGAYSLTGKTAVITGGNRGIGFGVTTAFARSGADVAILCRDIAKAESAVETLRGCGRKFEIIFCDVSDLASVRMAVERAYEVFGGIDILVNNAGISKGAKFLDMDENLSQWHRILNTNLNGAAHMTYEVGKRMRDGKKGGSIINISSNAGFMVNRGLAISPYSSAKAAVNQFTRSMAVELGEYDIRVNAIAPGFTRSDLGKNMSPEHKAYILGQQPLKRFGEPIEMGALAVYLASPAAAWVTGSVVVIDGGYMLTC
jgi:NAD(P)-dependent dehydrogenase (short-subunit alcohol dehydrogenase family)